MNQQKAIIQKQEIHQGALQDARQRQVIRNKHEKSLWYQNHLNVIKLEQIRTLELSGIDNHSFRIAVQKILEEKEEQCAQL